MTTRFDPDPLIAADPARAEEPTQATRERSRARLDALLDSAPKRRSRRPLAVVAAAGLAAFAAALAVLVGSPSSDPAQAFSARLQGGGIVHMVLAPERVHEASGDGTNPRQDEVWVSLDDGDWRMRSRIYGHYIDTSFDGLDITVYDSRTGRTATDTPTSPEQLAGRPFIGPMNPSIQPLRDAQMKVTGTTTIDGETVYDLTPADGPPAGLEVHWYVSEDGRLRRMVEAADDGSSLTTDVESYDVLEPTDANEALLRPQPE
jgi:hypothetical protein